jgi:hypothetical protein
MLLADTVQGAPANVISLAEYRRRLRPWHDDPPGPRPVATRKARDDALLSEVVVAAPAQVSRRAGCRQCA